MARKKTKQVTQAASMQSGKLYRFVDLASFTQDWSDLGWGDDELRLLEDAIARDPTHPPVVTGGGGARKIRFAHPSSNKGKSGGHRVLYAFFADRGIVLLLAAWAKSDSEDLEAKEYRAIGQVLARIRQLMIDGKIP